MITNKLFRGVIKSYDHQYIVISTEDGIEFAHYTSLIPKYNISSEDIVEELYPLVGKNIEFTYYENLYSRQIDKIKLI